jgi:malate/lactate dehydrogenase
VSTSQITAIVKDQFLQPIASKLVYFTDDDANGYITGSPATTNSNGVATVSYVAGSTANEVRITATAQQ